jgi:hypothetical protein
MPGIPFIWPALVEAVAELFDEIVRPDLFATRVEMTSTATTTAPVKSATL